MKDKGAPLIVPFAVAIDTREQRPYAFGGLVSDAKERRRPLVVPTEIRTLRSGDYSIVGHEDAIAIERKSLADLYGTLGQGRDRFVRELERLARLSFAAVVIEAEWSEIIGSPPGLSGLNPKTVLRSVIAWQQRYPRIHWWPCPERRFAEVLTYRILERWWKEKMRK
jgi:ERCC4-type nuclease